MSSRRFAFVCLLLTGCGAAAQDTTAPARTIDPVDNAEVELTLLQGGATFKLYRGGIYRVNERSGRWEFVAEGYDPDYFRKNYLQQDGAIFRKGDNGMLHRVGQEFSDDFENAETIRDLIGVERGWTSFTLQSPKTPTVADYVRLRNRILKGQADFLDNRIEPSSEVVHAGQTALKAHSHPRADDMVTNKASISTELIHFVQGDDVWFAGWYYVPAESGMPFTLMDLETTWFKEHPGIRIMVFGDKHLGVELKWGAKPTYCQPKGREIAFPRARWVHVKFHITLSEMTDGVVELWQDGTKIVDARGQTLPLAHIIYNSLEVGISAHSFGRLPATLYADDVSISDQPLDSRDSSIRVLRDVSFLGEGRREKLDLYLPNNVGPASRPAVVIIHGGGWQGGDKAAKREQNIGNTLAKAGYVCASINYVLAEKSDRLEDRLEQVWPENLHDCKTAVRFLRKNAGTYNIDPDRIGAIGGSAGGHLVAMLATTNQDDGLDPEGPHGEFSCRIQAVIPMYGVHDVLKQARKGGTFDAMTDAERELCQNASPVTYISRDDPPALILHGTNDALVPVEQSQILFDNLSRAGVPAELHIIEGAPHSFHLQPEQQDLREMVIQFLDRHLRSS